MVVDAAEENRRAYQEKYEAYKTLTLAEQAKTKPPACGAGAALAALHYARIMTVLPGLLNLNEYRPEAISDKSVNQWITAAQTYYESLDNRTRSAKPASNLIHRNLDRLIRTSPKLTWVQNWLNKLSKELDASGRATKAIIFCCFPVTMYAVYMVSLRSLLPLSP